MEVNRLMEICDENGIRVYEQKYEANIVVKALK